VAAALASIYYLIMMLCYCAQVHVAEDHAGNKLAVKVQHEGLRESADADIATIQALVNIAKFMFPTFDCECQPQFGPAMQRL